MHTRSTGLENTESFRPRIRININAINSPRIIPIRNIIEAGIREREMVGKWLKWRKEWRGWQGRKEFVCVFGEDNNCKYKADDLKILI